MNGSGRNGDGCDGNPFVNNRYAELPLQIFTGLHQLLGGAGNLIIYILVKHPKIGMGAIHQTDAHRYRADIQIHFGDHLIGFLHFTT
ncbi:hypothetical protein D3C81_1603260 [compost metagenome]